MQASVRISSEPDPVPVTEMDVTPRGTRVNYEAIDDAGTLKAVLKAKDEKIATLEQRLDMSKEALNGVKDRYKEKAETMEELVITLRRKLQTRTDQVAILAESLKQHGGNPNQVLGPEGSNMSPPSSVDAAALEDKYAKQLAAMQNQNDDLRRALEERQSARGPERDGRLERELMNERAKTQAAQQRLGELEGKLRELVATVQNVPFLEDRIRVLGQTLEAKDNAIANMQNQMSQRSDEGKLHALEQELQDARSQANEFNLEKARLQQDTHKLREELIARDNQIHAIQQRVVGEQGTKQDLLDQVERLTRSVDAMRIERDLLLSQQGAQQSEQERIATLEQELERARAARGESAGQIAQLEAEVGRFRGAVEELVGKEQVKSAAAATAALKEQHLQSVVSALQTQLAARKADAEAAGKQVAELQGQLDKTETERAGAQAGLEQQLAASRAQNSQMFAASHAEQERAAALEREVGAKDQTIRGLTEQLQALQGQFVTQNKSLADATVARQHEEAEAASLAERVQHLNQHVKARDAEVQASREQLATVEAEVSSLQQEKEKINYSLAQISQECEVQQEKLRALRATDETKNSRVRELEEKLVDLKREKDDLVARCAQSAEDLVEAHEEKKVFEQRIADMAAQVGIVTKQVQSKDASLANLVQARQTLSQRMAGLEGEVSAARAEKEALAKRLQDADGHLQLTETRGMGLEKRVRELSEQAKELAAAKEQMRDKDVEIERLQVRGMELEAALSKSSEAATVLTEKDATINEWVRRNNALLQELETMHNDKAAMQQKMQGMAQQLANSTGATEDLQRQLEKANDSMKLSDKILTVSKEQTAAISQLQERIEEQEALLRAKERERQDLEASGRRETAQLRDQIMGLTQTNQALQTQCEHLKDGVQSKILQRSQVSQSQVDELHDQLMSAIDQKQSHYMEATRLRSREHRLKASVVQRLFALKNWPLLSTFLHAWQQLAEGNRATRVPSRRIQAPSPSPQRTSAPPPGTGGFVATVEVNDASGHVVLSSGANYVLEKSTAPPINFAPSTFAAHPSEIPPVPAPEPGYLRDWGALRASGSSYAAASTLDSGSAPPISYQPPSLPTATSYLSPAAYQRSPAAPSPYQPPHQSVFSDPYPYPAPQPQRGSPPFMHSHSPEQPPAAPHVLHPQPAAAPYQQPHSWAPQILGNGAVREARGFDSTEIIL